MITWNVGAHNLNRHILLSVWISGHVSSSLYWDLSLIFPEPALYYYRDVSNFGTRRYNLGLINNLIPWMAGWQAAVASCYFTVKALFQFYQSLKLMTLHKEAWNSLMMYVVSNHKLALIDVRTLKQGQAVKMCLVPQHSLAVLLLRLVIYAPLNNEKKFSIAYCQKFN